MANIREEFPGFFLPGNEDFSRMWKDGTIVLDTNVLLALHRLPESARKDMLALLRKLKDRLWLPHHVMLEYQRRRPFVVLDQLAKFDEVGRVVNETRNKLRSEIEKLDLERRHSLIDPAPYLKAVDDETEKFLQDLNQLRIRQPNLGGKDPVQEEIAAILSGRIGSAYATQGELDNIYKEGQTRFESKIPPGFADSQKEKGNEAPEFFFNGLRYERKYGDLIIWKQILDQVRDKSVASLIFVTDDRKEDWWWIVKSGGDRVLGPHPSLVKEIGLSQERASFHMLDSSSFLKFGTEFLKVSIAVDSVDQVREVASQVRARDDSVISASEAESAVLSWITRAPEIEVLKRPASGFPDLVTKVIDSDRTIAWEVKYLRDPKHFHIFPIISHIALRWRETPRTQEFVHLNVALCGPDYEAARQIAKGVDATLERIEMPFNVVVGYVADSDAGLVFEPLRYILSSEKLPPREADS